tara:strand:+ start:813 stop:1526 length:714 start_codon:yes stop_codon:yes gene_type:complete
MLPREKEKLILRYRKVVDKLRKAEENSSRPAGSTSLIAVSKTYSAEEVRVVAEEGQHNFGENQLQDAMKKIPFLQDLGCIWHFIGPIQSNKCKDIAQHFDWVHSVDRYKVAHKLSHLRSGTASPLNLLIQVNLQNETTKSGVSIEELEPLILEIKNLPNVKIRGLMSIPTPESEFEKQRLNFLLLRELKNSINIKNKLEMDCLSMGMTNDMEAAVFAGATHVRIGTAIFGPRRKIES